MACLKCYYILIVVLSVLALFGLVCCLVIFLNFPKFKRKSIWQSGSIPTVFAGLKIALDSHLPRAPPLEMLDEFTMGGRILVYDMFFDERVSTTSSPVIFDLDTVKKMIAPRLGQAPVESYPGVIRTLQQILKNNVSCFGKDVAVIGTLIPWIETVLLQHGCKSIVTVDYNVLNILPEVSDKFKWTSVHYTSFCSSPQQFDLICTFSSIEHDGLGRYGDPIRPSADFEAMSVIRNKLKTKGLVLWGAPVGTDALVWNAHRVYGPIRLPQLLHGFRADAWITKFTYLSNFTNGEYYQPWIILSKADADKNSKKEFELVHESIISCPKYE